MHMFDTLYFNISSTIFTLLSCQEAVITTSGLAGYWKPLVGSQRVCSTGSKCRASHSSWQKPPVTLEPWPWETSRCVQQFGDKGCSREWNAPIGIKHLDSLKFPVSMPRLAKAEVLCCKDQHSKLCPIGSNYWLSSCDIIIILYNIYIYYIFTLSEIDMLLWSIYIRTLHKVYYTRICYIYIWYASVLQHSVSMIPHNFPW